MKIFFLFFLFIVINVNAMNCSDYSEFEQFNGHYYSVSIDKLTFESANQIAKNNGGTLAIPNSQEENDFIKNLIGGGSIGWIGIYDPNKLQNYCFGTNCIYDSSRFKDVKNNSLLYKNFYFNQPDNLVKEYDVVDGKQMVSPLGEYWVAMDGNNGKWHDFGNHADAYNNPVKYKAIFEFENLNECKPLTDDGVQELTGLFCNTKIWDSTIDTITMGQTLDCQVDSYGNTYCPSALAACGEQWDYENGYSTSGVGQVVDYTSKITATSYQNALTRNVLANLNLAGSVHCNSRYHFWGEGNRWYTTYYLGDTSRGDGSFLEFVYDKDSNMVRINGRMWEHSVFDTWTNNTNIVQFHNAGSPRGSLIFNVINGNYSITGEARTEKTTIKTNGSNCIYFDSCGTGEMKLCFQPVYTSENYCPQGWQYNGYVEQGCSQNIITCPNGYTETTGAETVNGQCKRTQEYTYYNYLCNNETNTQGYNYVPINSGGDTGKTDIDNTVQNDLTNPLNDSTPPVNNCKREKFTCLANSERPCSYVDNKWQCSPFPCMGQSNFENLDTQVGISDKDNDGWSEDGACTGTIYIFNGKSNKCRTWDMLFGLMGGGCCDKEKVFAGLVACKENEKLLAKQREQKQAHYIGNFCSKQLKLGFAKICVQKSDSYCTFSSSLAKIIQEQGREQLGISWGSPENPQCRGFTPEEFQKIDFSKIDLTEFVKDIQSSVQTSVIQNLGTYVKDKVGDFYGN